MHSRLPSFVALAAAVVLSFAGTPLSALQGRGADALAAAAVSPSGPEARQGAIAEGPPQTLPAVRTAYLVTIGPGSAVWERFGHNLIWIHDPVAGTRQGYNYGLFSFEQENFILRFVQGDMRYWMAGLDLRRQLDAYAGEGRAIWMQELALDPAEVRDLQAFLEWNERPENRFYRYHYYRDNCSTRIRDALDRILEGRLGAWAHARGTRTSYRDHTLRLTHDLFWVRTGMHFGLGPSVEEPLEAWEAMFIPMEMQEHLRAFTVENEEGEPIPFVQREWQYEDGNWPPAPEETPRSTGTFLVVGLLGAAVVGGLTRVGGRGSPRIRRTLLALTVPWLAVVGLAGLAVTLLWAFTDHVDTALNLNLFHAHPLHLLLALTLPLAPARTRAARAVAGLAGLIVVLSLLGVITQILTPLDQTNGEFLALLLPMNFAVAWAAWRLHGRQRLPSDRTGAAAGGAATPRT